MLYRPTGGETNRSVMVGLLLASKSPLQDLKSRHHGADLQLHGLDSMVPGSVTVASWSDLTDDISTVSLCSMNLPDLLSTEAARPGLMQLIHSSRKPFG